MLEGRIPFTVIGGFLGSGKTTLINRVLRGLSGVRATVLVNDFGSVNIDGQLIAAMGGEAISLVNGCVCCSIGGDLTDALIRVIETKPLPEWLIVEASGVSDPWKIAQVGMVDPALLLEGIVVLVDAESVRAHATDPYLSDTIFRQLAAADVLVLNKTDLVDPEVVNETRAWLNSQALKGWIHQTVEADVPLELLCSLTLLTGPTTHQLQRPTVTPIGSRYASHDHQDPTHVFSAWTFETERVFSKKKLQALLHVMPSSIIRAKGIVRTDAALTHATVFQFAGKSRRLQLCGPWTGKHSQIVFIGSSNDTRPAAAVQALLEDALS